MQLFFLHRAVYLVVFFFCSTAAYAVTFSGTVSLPSGVTAPAGGLEVEVSTFPIEFNFSGQSFSSSSDTVTIPAGSATAVYSFEVSDGFSGGDVSLEFECANDCGGLSITSDGFISREQGIVSNFDASKFSTSSDNSVNINLELATVFSGQIIFPDDLIATGEEFFSLRVESTARFSFGSFATFRSARAGQNRVAFSIGVPTDMGGSGWNLRLSCLGCAEPLLLPDSQNFYAATVIGDPLSTSEDDAFAFPSTQNFPGLELTLPSESPPGTTSGGFVIVPIFLLLDE